MSESDPGDASYINSLQDFSSRIEQFLENNAHKDTPAYRDLAPEYERLRQKASSKIRDFLLVKIRGLSRSNTNIQIIQHNVLLKYKALNAFLIGNHPSAAMEIRQTYNGLVSAYFSKHFARYQSLLSPMQLHVTDKADLLGIGDSQVRKGIVFL